MEFPIPHPLKAEHEELHAELARARDSGGRTGEAAKLVAKILHPHFVREEEIAMPPLALLQALAGDKVSPEMSQVLSMTDSLEAELPQMLDQHREIVTALERLARAANDEGKPRVARFAEKLILHAQTEEQVLYPAAILIGRYVKLKLGS
jgi:hemerythrin superfamily protein